MTSCAADAVTTVAMANRQERQRLMSLPRLASSPPLAHPLQLSTLVAQAAADAQQAEAAAAAAVEKAVATAASAAALASRQAAPVSLHHQGSEINREREGNLTSGNADSCSNSKEECALVPGLRVRTNRARPSQHRRLHLQPGSQISADADSLGQHGRASSFGAAGRPNKCPRTSSMVCI
eukprot:1150148-Pelagomonas_calceolata.AAC.2